MVAKGFVNGVFTTPNNRQKNTMTNTRIKGRIVQPNQPNGTADWVGHD
jgi:hypothetical protein